MNNQKKIKRHDQGAADVEKVTPIDAAVSGKKEIESATSTEQSTVMEEASKDESSGASTVEQSNPIDTTSSSAENEEVQTSKLEDVEQASEEVAKKKKSGSTGLLKVTSLTFVIAAFSSGGWYLYNSNGGEFPDLVNFASGSNRATSVETISQENLNRLSLEMRDVKEQLAQLNLPQTIDTMKTQNQLLQERINSAIESFNAEVDRFAETSRKRSEEILELKEVVTKNKTFGDSERKNLSNRLIQIELEQEREGKELLDKIEREVTKLKALKSSTQTSAPKTNQKKAPKAAQASTQTTTPTTKQITTIGTLALEKISRFGSQYVAQLTDGLSGAMPIIKGDRLGQYSVVDINDEGVTLKDQIGNVYLMPAK
ncbi:hypothetical protein VTH8203_01347 [Vibrio thalassae]|uniref:Uncharacterized protein n=1 Tax=Vibrio thalassae TaxID=1243014 RepID=A0A240EGE1_9VIBR|nr:hypothetical protein [Vibrio thalassae]SNX47732.1 hypothetical protein VTH8203_01347 [Vibrio thalassae]